MTAVLLASPAQAQNAEVLRAEEGLQERQPHRHGDASARWCTVNYLNFESTVAKDVHVLGDSIQVAPAMSKSAHMANSHAKVTAAAIVAEFAGGDINPAPMLTNTC